MNQHLVSRYVPLPSIPTDAMLLDLALFTHWDDTPGELREDFEQAYQRLLAVLPKTSDGLSRAPVEPGEQVLLAIAGVAEFDEPGEDTCPEFEMAYEGYQLMLANMGKATQP